MLRLMAARCRIGQAQASVPFLEGLCKQSALVLLLAVRVMGFMPMIELRSCINFKIRRQHTIVGPRSRSADGGM